MHGLSILERRPPASIVVEETLERVLSRFAIGCLDNAMHRGMAPLLEEDYARAKATFHSGNIPTLDELRRWFPRPFEALERYNLPETADGMRRYWLDYHNRDDVFTPVLTCDVVELLPGGAKVRVRGGTAWTPAVNLWNLPLKLGTCCYVHAGVIAALA